jgi:hypothetical protein
MSDQYFSAGQYWPQVSGNNPFIVYPTNLSNWQRYSGVIVGLACGAQPGPTATPTPTAVVTPTPAPTPAYTCNDQFGGHDCGHVTDPTVTGQISEGQIVDPVSGLPQPKLWGAALPTAGPTPVTGQYWCVQTYNGTVPVMGWCQGPTPTQTPVQTPTAAPT